MPRRLSLAALLLVAACTFKPDPDKDRFVCQADADCGEGWRCVPQKSAANAGRSFCYLASELSPEICNGLDDDKDGVVDGEVLTDIGVACDTGKLGACAPGLTVCVNQQLRCLGADPVVETCNTADDNCDGAVDDGFDLQTDDQNCGSCGNVCEAAGTGCLAGQCHETDCSDTLDNDAAGGADCLDASCDGKSCAAHGKLCEQSACVCPGGEAAAETSCGDGQDNDCDGLIDCADPDCDAKTCDTGKTCAASTCQ
jgi:hypothetical protein